jgi:RNA polymerase-binding transcription factor DksA
VRDRLVDGMGVWKAQLAHESAVFDLLTANRSEDPTGVDGALTALHMYEAVEAIEEFEEALVRLEVGRYGTCQWCGRWIPIERLEVIPQARFCAACPPAADTSRRPWRRRGRREHIDGCPPLVDRFAVARASVDPGVVVGSRARHPSSIRYEHAIDDRAR